MMLDLQSMEISSSLVTNVLFQLVGLAMSMNGRREIKSAHSAKLGCVRVQGDDEEDDIDDIENEINYMGRDNQDMHQYLAESMLQGHMSYGRAGDMYMLHVVHTMPQVPLLTNGQMPLGFLISSQSGSQLKEKLIWIDYL